MHELAFASPIPFIDAGGPLAAARGTEGTPTTINHAIPFYCERTSKHFPVGADSVAVSVRLPEKKASPPMHGYVDGPLRGCIVDAWRHASESQFNRQSRFFARQRGVYI